AFDCPKPPERFRTCGFAGVESAWQIKPAGKRLDMIAGVQHDRQAAHDYALLREMGIRSARDGLRWHLIDRGCGKYDFSSFLPMLQAAEREGIQVLWDVCYYGWPDDIDLFSDDL